MFRSRRIPVLIAICVVFLLLIAYKGERVSDAQPLRHDQPVSITASGAANASTDPGWWAAVQENLWQSEYAVTWQDHTYLSDLAAAYQAPNRAQNLRTYFTPAGIRVIPRTGTQPNWDWGLTLTGYGVTEQIQPVTAADLVVHNNRVDYRRASFTESFTNDEQGLKQALTLDHSLADSASHESLVIRFGFSGDLTARLSTDAHSVEFDKTDGQPALRYNLVRVTDTNGQMLPTQMVVSESTREIQIVIADGQAAYPLSIELAITTPRSLAPGVSATADWTANGDQASANFGAWVGTAGDVNGDGYAEVIVGAQGYDAGETDEGRAYVFYGSAQGLSTTPGWIVESNSPNAYFGASVNTAGDVNGDGFGDVIVGAWQYSNDQSQEGKAYLYLGSASGLNTTPAWTAEGNETGAHFGTTAVTAGDVNGDGYGDVIVGARYYWITSESGRAYLYFGSPTGLSLTANWMAQTDQGSANFGRSVSTAGDVNGDGYSDIIVGAYDYNVGFGGEDGRVYIYHGSPTGPSLTPDQTLSSDAYNAHFGIEVGTAGDVNGDGYSDIIVGQEWYSGGQTQEGRALVYYGSASGVLSTPAWSVEGNQDGARLGYSAGTAGDVNGDGYVDVIIGAWYYSNGQTYEGQAYVYLGSAGGLATAPIWTAESDQVNAIFGNEVSTAGDVNGDGYADVIVGAYLYDDGQTDEGRAFVYYGSASGVSTTSAWTAESDQAGTFFGYSVGTAGDVNGDGYADVIVGALYYDNGQTDEGRAFAYYGSASGLSTSANWTAESDQAGALFGVSVGTAGDVNGDGYADVIVGAHNYDNGQTDEGRVFVYYGSASGLSASVNWTAESNQAGADFGFLAGTAGDANGDGYADVIIGAMYYDNGQTDEGRVFVYYGSASGLSTSANWTAESNQAAAELGVWVSTAGDVNGDGYADVIAGARYYDNGQTDEGRAFVYYGSASGLSTSPNWTAESDQAGAEFGDAVGTAGDVNGDGYADVIVGALLYDNGQTDEGRAFVYYGSASGLSTNANWTADGDQAAAYFGFTVGTAGDVNGDGYADVIVGAYQYDNDQTDEGRAFVYYGSASGLSTSANWTAEGDQVGAGFGYSAGTAGDVNGDGYADVIVGAIYYDNGQGRAFVYYGNEGSGLSMRPRQMRADGSVHIAPLGKSDSATAFQIRLNARMPLGREKVKLQWQVAPLGVPFSATTIISGTSLAWTDTLTGNVSIIQNVVGLTPNTPYHWRVRLLYDTGNRLGQSASRWIHIPWNAWTEQDFRTPGGALPPQCIPQASESDIVLILDRSGSMAGDNKLRDAKLAITTFVSATNAPPDQVSLVSFSDTAALNQPLTTTKAAVLAALQVITATGTTRIDYALLQARQELTSTRHIITHTNVIILLTDGNQNPAGNDPVITQANAAKAEGATIFTIGLGPDADAALLQTIATNPGYYYFAPTGAQLQEIYRLISAAIACPDIGGQVFIDNNHDGRFTTGRDLPIANAPVRLNGNTGPQFATTGANGRYLFADNFGGNYTVTLANATVPIGYRPTTPLSYVVTLATLDDVDNDFGFGPPSYLYLPLVLRNYCTGPTIDDFSNPASGWPIVDTTYWTYGYTSGEYRLYAKNSAVGAVTRGDRQQGQLIVEVDARQTSTVNGSMGLVFGINDDWSELYTFEVYPPTREYYLYRFANGQWTLMAHGTTAVIQPGSAVNRLRLAMTAPTSLELYVNGAYLTTLAQPFDRSANRRVGLTATSDAASFEARFDNYKLVPEGCPANAVQAIDRAGDHPDQFFEDATRPKWFSGR